ncbi:MAG: hypothetical protein ABIA93_05695 [Candidatus Woesearchaeota archaeon]
MDKNLDLLTYLPRIISTPSSSRRFPLVVRAGEEYLNLSYSYSLSYNRRREMAIVIPRFVSSGLETFQVAGLLQAEMGKTNNGCLVFANSEYQLVNHVLNWFQKELHISPSRWHWYIRVNVEEPTDLTYKERIEEKVLWHWISKTSLISKKKYPRTVTYRKNAGHKTLYASDYGTMMIEIKNNLLSHVMKQFVAIIRDGILGQHEDHVRYFMRGILAGESNVELNKKIMKYRVFLCAPNICERRLYRVCFRKLGVASTLYKKFPSLIISRKENLIKLLQQKLMCLSPQKYNKFLNMMKHYRDIRDYGYFTGAKVPHNKIPDSTVQKIIQLGLRHPDWLARHIAKQVGVSSIKVQRVLKENNLGVRRQRTSVHLLHKILELHLFDPHFRACDIAAILGIDQNVVWRYRRKQGLRLGRTIDVEESY